MFNYKLISNLAKTFYFTVNSYSKNAVKTAPVLVEASKKRLSQQRRKKISGQVQGMPGFWTVVAFTTAKQYDLSRIQRALNRQGKFIPTEITSNATLETGPANALHAISQQKINDENTHLFFFEEGSVVMWNIDETERMFILEFLQPYEFNSYDYENVHNELETMPYTYSKNSTRSFISNGIINIACNEKSVEELCLDRYTFSNCMSLSVKLGILESRLEKYIEGIEFVTEDLKAGLPMRINQAEALKKSGELAALRHSINLSLDLLDVPDFYWDRDELEHVFRQTCNYFSISRRTKVMNEKLNHCVELMQLVSSFLSDKHHVRLEWMIIVLIMVEVAFEFIHYMKS